MSAETSAAPDRGTAGLPDARPRVERDRVAGMRCTECRYPASLVRPRCPNCGAAMKPELFGPTGTVWSSTLVNLELPGQPPPPVGLAYVDLDDGPRVLAHGASGDGPIPVGARVEIDAAGSAGGELTVVVA